MAEYYVPARDSETEFTEKRSRFIGHVWRVEQEASSGILTMESPREPRASQCWRSFAGREWRMSAAW